MEDFALIIVPGKIMIAPTKKCPIIMYNRVLSWWRATVSHISWTRDVAILNYANGTTYYSHTLHRFDPRYYVRTTGWNSPRSSQSDSSDKTRRRCPAKMKKDSSTWRVLRVFGCGKPQARKGLPKLLLCTFMWANIMRIIKEMCEIIFNELRDTCRFHDAYSEHSLNVFSWKWIWNFNECTSLKIEEAREISIGKSLKNS